MAKGFKHGSGGYPTTGVPEFTYTGSYKTVNESGENWHVEFYTSGVLNFQKTRNATDGIEVFLVGGGNSGANGNDSGGGRGGNGGTTQTGTATPVQKTDYPITIGAGGGTTSAFGYTAPAGGGASGGSGGSLTGAAPNGNNGSDGTRAFGDATYARYGAGGGGGAGAWDGANGRAGMGGDYGGGKGGGAWNDPATAGLPNTGGGGGGGVYGNYIGASGGSGIVIIRNKRS